MGSPGFAMRRCGPHPIGDRPAPIWEGVVPSMETGREPAVGAGIHGRTGMDDRPAPPPSELRELPEDDPRLGGLVRDLRRAAAAANPADRAFVLGRLEALARRFHEQGRTSP